MKSASSIALLIVLPVMGILLALATAPRLTVAGETYDLTTDAPPSDARIVVQTGHRYALWTAHGLRSAALVYRELPAEGPH